MLGEPTFYRLATVFDDHSTCWMMLEHVWCSIKHLIQYRPTFLFVLMLNAWKFVRLASLNNMLYACTRIVTANSVVTIDTACLRQCSLKMSASEEAAQNIDKTCSKKKNKKKKHQNEKQEVGATRKLAAWSTYWKGIDAYGMIFVPTTTWKTREKEHILRSKRN